MGWFFGLLLNIALSLLIGKWASSKGRNGLLWFLFAVVTTPLISSIALLVVGDKQKYLDY